MTPKSILRNIWRSAITTPKGRPSPAIGSARVPPNSDLNGITTADEFTRLCENFHPQTGERLTLRQKTTRTEMGADGKERETANRRVFYDFTFSPPKSVSIAALVGDDSRIVEAHEQAVTAAMNQLQTFAATRVRKKTNAPTGRRATW